VSAVGEWADQMRLLRFAPGLMARPQARCIAAGAGAGR
jgi:hypothetical protein